MNRYYYLRTEKYVYTWILILFFCLTIIGCAIKMVDTTIERHQDFDQKILFSSNRDGNWDIYKMNANGSQLINLTNHPADERGPAWSPDGNRIAFFSNRDGNKEIYIINEDGSEPERLTHSLASDTWPAWSPDAKKLLYVSGHENQRDIYVIYLDDLIQINLTRTNLADEMDPAWMPDGKRIVFVSDQDGNKEIYIINIDGTGLTRLTHNLLNDGYPRPFPNGSGIVFLSDRNGKRNLFIMNIDGSNQRDFPGGIVSRNVCAAFGWSYNGERIAFATEGTHNSDIYMMNRDGSGKIRLGSIDKDECPDMLSWSLYPPKIAYAWKQNGNWEIYMMPLKYQVPEPKRLTDNQVDDATPVWEPRDSNGTVYEHNLLFSKDNLLQHHLNDINPYN
jgi:Tol biopolymer transport system component